MKQEIWKYPLGIADLQNIKMPQVTHPLCVQLQRGTPCIWASVFPGNKLVDREIHLIGTGQDISALGILTYVGTLQFLDGLVLHVFMDVEK